MGYLALVLHEDEYDATANSVPFIRPTNPGVFQFVSPFPLLTIPQEPSLPIGDQQEALQVSQEHQRPRDATSVYDQQFVHGSGNCSAKSQSMMKIQDVTTNVKLLNKLYVNS